MTTRNTHKPIHLGVGTMLLNEDLARIRMREAEQAASQQRLIRRLTAAKRWNRVSNWAAKRASRIESTL
jgi:hypothetical protein